MSRSALPPPRFVPHVPRRTRPMPEGGNPGRLRGASSLMSLELRILITFLITFFLASCRRWCERTVRSLCRQRFRRVSRCEGVRSAHRARGEGATERRKRERESGGWPERGRDERWGTGSRGLRERERQRWKLQALPRAALEADSRAGRELLSFSLSCSLVLLCRPCAVFRKMMSDRRACYQNLIERLLILHKVYAFYAWIFEEPADRIRK